jgi:hypothetical protein
MTRDADQPAASPAKEETFVQRWSRRKRAADREGAKSTTAAAIEPPMAPPASPIGDARSSNQETTSAKQTATEPPPLPPVESLTFESDFRAFLQPNVAEDLKREALKKLLHDPRFNVMDGLDVYIDDYSIPSPLEPAVARALVSARCIFDPPSTRVNAQGHVEEIPAAEAAAPGEGETVEDHEAGNETVERLRAPENHSTSPENHTSPPENHTTPPAFAGTPPRERRGEADENSTVHAARDHSNVPLLTRRGGTPDCTEGVVQKRLDRATAAEIAPPDELRDEGEARR